MQETDDVSIFWVNERQYEALKQKLQLGADITHDDLEKLAFADRFPDDAVMIPVDLQGTHIVLGQPLEDVEDLVIKLGYKGAFEAFVKARNHFEQVTAAVDPQIFTATVTNHQDKVSVSFANLAGERVFEEIEFISECRIWDFCCIVLDEFKPSWKDVFLLSDDGDEIEKNEALLKTHSRLTMGEVNPTIAKPISGREYNFRKFEEGFEEESLDGGDAAVDWLEDAEEEQDAEEEEEEEVSGTEAEDEEERVAKRLRQEGQ